ncbi:YjbF family lipoprotein [Oceanicola sp. D3]|uniref:YjbF family lipoprotein n=1 Tax=Oceanicola sp. D3 TaxID=2587163 RepID=UPI001121BA4F|nr:YjbF family lipoprotein [Oceanicola sp. D3]QDC09115.1 YjbF family lipoprotein [Oceanicola sp. D3]
MKPSLALLSTLVLAACGGLGVGSDSPPSPNQLRTASTARFAQLLEAGTPAIQVAVEKDESSTIVLREVSRNGVESYVSTDGVSLKLRRGFLVGTAGFGGDMTGSNVDDSMAAVFGRRAGVTERFHTFLNGENEAVTRGYVCVVSSRGARQIQVGTRDSQLRSVDTTLFEEACKSLDQDYTNLYWLAAGSGRMVQSRQWAGDFTGPLVMRVVME